MSLFQIGHETNKRRDFSFLNEFVTTSDHTANILKDRHVYKTISLSISKVTRQVGELHVHFDSPFKQNNTETSPSWPNLNFWERPRDLFLYW